MNKEQLTLWHRIQHHPFDQIDAAFPFSHRLARDNDWSIAYAQQVIEEYKKFMFLICVSGHPCTPSDQVDQVWHLHLVYTQDYWKHWCAVVLQQDIHHGPTKGGVQERKKFKSWYAQTKTSYQQFFRQMPPTSIWPNEQKRFHDIDFRRININEHYILPKHQLLTGLICSLSIPLFVYSTFNQKDLSFMIGVGLVIALFLYLFSGNDRNNRHKPPPSQRHKKYRRSQHYGSSGCGHDGGCGGCGGCGG